MENRVYAPIVLFVYNRPEHTKQTVEGILANPEARFSDLYIFSDGAKKTATADAMGKVKRVREYIHTISGFKSITIFEAHENRGLAPSTISGLSKMFELYDRLIMIEDDDVPTPYFLKYVNEGLERYKDDVSIWSIGGYIDTDYAKPTQGPDVFLVNRPTSWGFGTWKRCWDKVIWDIESLKGIFSHKSICEDFSKWGGGDSSAIMFQLFQGRVSSWSIRYNFAAYLNDAKSVLPQKSLINNSGMDGSGTHSGILQHSLVMFDRPVVYPDKVLFDKLKNRQINKFFDSRKVFSRILASLGIFIRVKILLNADPFYSKSLMHKR